MFCGLGCTVCFSKHDVTSIECGNDNTFRSVIIATPQYMFVLHFPTLLFDVFIIARPRKAFWITYHKTFCTSNFSCFYFVLDIKSTPCCLGWVVVYHNLRNYISIDRLKLTFFKWICILSERKFRIINVICGGSTGWKCKNIFYFILFNPSVNQGVVKISGSNRKGLNIVTRLLIRVYDRVYQARLSWVTRKYHQIAFIFRWFFKITF